MLYFKLGRRKLPQWAEALADFVDIELWLFPRGEMAAAIKFIPMDDVRQVLFGPAAGGAEDFLADRC